VPELITHLAYDSLAELYAHYIREYVHASPIIAACGCEIHCYEHHFVHMIKLCDPAEAEFFFPNSKARILETVVGFGEFEHDQLRARWLLAALETLRKPDKVVRTADLETSDRAFIKQFTHSHYPYVVALVGKDEGKLTLRTAFPIRKGRLKRWMEGDVLFPKTPQPPE
jgi:phage-Barnase-EndoU-ColicinE5/D-RelE like nuclease2